MMKIDTLTRNGLLHYSLTFEYNQALIPILRKHAKVLWSRTYRCWYFNENSGKLQKMIHELENSFGIKCELSDEVKKKLNPIYSETEKAIDNLREWMTSKRYSESTIKGYIEALVVFFKETKPTNHHEISENDLIKFNNNYILKNKLSFSYQNQFVNALKLFYALIPEKKISIFEIHRPRREHKLPNVLSKEEVKLILGSLSNIKHRTMLSLIYSCGLRCGELIKLKLNCIDSDRNLVMIKNAKGRKDRIVPLSAKILEMLRDYYRVYKPQLWLFEGLKAGIQYDERSLQSVLKNAVKKAGITKPVTLHWLRHSYATHLLEAGTDLRYIQEILGHSRSSTTEIYTHVSTKSIQKIASPFDSL